MADGRTVDMIGEGWHSKVFANSGHQTADIGTATDGCREVGDSEAVAWRAAFFEDIPVGADIGSPKVITEGFAEVGYWWNAIDFCERVFYYFGPHFRFYFS